MRVRFLIDLRLRSVATIALFVALASSIAACTGDRTHGDADAATDGFAVRDGDVFFDTIAVDATDGSPADVTAPRWNCPPEWVPFERGGCGPAVFLCVPGGGAMTGACDAIDVMRPRVIGGADGGAPGVSFFVQPDGGIGGGWNAPRAGGDAGTLCPPGWSGADGVTCEPTLRNDCPLGTSALPDGTCTATGSDACPTTPFADPGPEAMGATVVHVLAGADPAAADGTEAHPYATIAAGIAQAGVDGFVLVGEGAYAEALVVDHGVHVIGVCAARSRLAANATDAASLHATNGAHVDVKNLLIAGAGGGVLADAASQLSLDSIRIDGATGFALMASGGGTAVNARDLFVSNTRFVVGGAPGVGVRVREGAMFTGTRVAYVSNHGGIAVRDPGSSATLVDAVVRDSLPRYDGQQPAGLGAFDGGTLHASFVIVAASAGFGVVSDQAGSTVIVEDGVITESVPLSDSAPGIGAQARGGGAITLVRTRVDHNRAAGVSSIGVGTRLELADTAVNDTMPTLSGSRGFAIDVQAGAVVADRTLLTAATEAGVFALGGRVELHDAIVTGTHPSIRGLGFGIAAGSGTQLTARHVAITDVSGAAIVATNAAATLPAEGANAAFDDLFVRGIRESTVQISQTDEATGASAGYGLASTAASTLRASYLVVADGSIGFFSHGASLVLDTGVVTGQSWGSALPSASPSSAPMLYNIVFLGNENDGPKIDPALPDPLSRP